MAPDLVQPRVRLQTDRHLVSNSTLLHPRLIDVIRHIRLEQRDDVRIQYESWLTGGVLNGVLGDVASHMTSWFDGVSSFAFCIAKDAQLRSWRAGASTRVLVSPHDHAHRD
jgi:hypothetical protein